MTDNYSVLMSVYYKEEPEYLKEAIDSILNQTVKTDDFVIVCDGPLTEGLDKVIADYVKTYSGLFTVYRLSRNIGLAKALNNGILQCKNELIARMDSDDISAPDRIEKQIAAINEKKADIVGANIIEFVGNINNTGNSRIVPEKNEDIITFAKKRSPFNHPTIMYKKSAVIAAGFYEDYRFFEDFNLWATMLNMGYKGYNIQENLLYMRGGEEMYKRRGGFSYVGCIYRFKKHLKKIGFIGEKDFLVGVLGHAVVSIIPNGIREKIYSKLLRKAN
ncbi:glycosyltransferase [uncultured Eubacterium sp.]|uniref:glycosyltransferase n=1 Tax=uncultured Eubacterium sp. TaxID=165185 RepID=UPI002673A0FC|nr:glycosyltransferase [uncultured Eubacterium sp.]